MNHLKIKIIENAIEDAADTYAKENGVRDGNAFAKGAMFANNLLTDEINKLENELLESLAKGEREANRRAAESATLLLVVFILILIIAFK